MSIKVNYSKPLKAAFALAVLLLMTPSLKAQSAFVTNTCGSSALVEVFSVNNCAFCATGSGTVVDGTITPDEIATSCDDAVYAEVTIGVTVFTVEVKDCACPPGNITDTHCELIGGDYIYVVAQCYGSNIYISITSETSPC